MATGQTPASVRAADRGLQLLPQCVRQIEAYSCSPPGESPSCSCRLGACVPTLVFVRRHSQVVYFSVALALLAQWGFAAYLFAVRPRRRRDSHSAAPPSSLEHVGQHMGQYT